MSQISIHAPAKGVTYNLLYRFQDISISIHAPAKGATPTERSRKVIWYYFYSRPREGGDQHCEPLSPYVLNFYSRPREGGDASIDGQDISAYISIHAPAKGATIDKVCINYREYISIHAPAKGATFLLGYHHCILTYFYSRPREGGDMRLLL